jgi:tetratricopeptide (TPR) repeat protein
MVFSVTVVKKLFITFLVVGLTACVSVDPYPQPSVPVIEGSDSSTEEEMAPETQSTTVPKKVNEVATAPAVVNNLLVKAKKQQGQGDLSSAMSTVERAIRIAPRYPASYYQLAELKFDANEFSDAKSLAQKAISLGASGSLKRSALELVIASENYISQGL